MYGSRAIIFDVDGTLADNEHRRHLITGDDLSEFETEIAQDKTFQPIVDMAKMYYGSGEYKVILCTARAVRWHLLTVGWLRRVGVGFDLLCMRQDGDDRPDYLVKLDMLADIRDQGYAPVMVVEDRTRCVTMWREAGLICLQCAPGNF